MSLNPNQYRWEADQLSDFQAPFSGTASGCSADKLRAMVNSLSIFRIALVAAAALTLTGCEIPFLDDGSAKKAAEMETEGKAIGSACRHALRGVEDCYTLNPAASKSAVFAGWKEMDQYMRDNKLDGMQAVVPKPVAKAVAEAPEEDEPPEPPPKKKTAAKH
jgi:hypothetical protein